MRKWYAYIESKIRKKNSLMYWLIIAYWYLCNEEISIKKELFLLPFEDFFRCFFTDSMNNYIYLRRVTHWKCCINNNKILCPRLRIEILWWSVNHLNKIANNTIGLFCVTRDQDAIEERYNFCPPSSYE